MGVSCWSSRHIREDKVSDRDIKEESEKPTLHHGFPTLACGYKFSLNNEMLEENKKNANVLER